MSSNSFADTVDVTLRPSMRAFTLLFGVHVVAIALVPFAMQPGPVMWALLVLFCMSWLGLRRHPVFGFGNKALVRLVWHVDGGWRVYDGSGRAYDAQLMGSSYIHSSLLVLNYRLGSGGRRARAVLGDDCDAELLRRLRARLMLLKDTHS